MSIRIASVFLTLVAISAAGAGGYYAGSSGFRVEGLAFSALATSKTAPASATGPVIYYRDPDGKPFYAASPRKTADGRDFLPVLASEDINFDDQASLKEKPSATAAEPSAASARKILYYRNPMGLPDTSPVPKKDSMGMDYLPVYDGEDSDDGTLKISLGKMQRSGVRTERAANRVLSHTRASVGDDPA